MPELDDLFPEVEGTHRLLPEVDFGNWKPIWDYKRSYKGPGGVTIKQEEDFTGGHLLEVTFGTIGRPIPLPGG